MLVVFPCAMMAGEIGPMVLPSGAVSINSDRIAMPTAVFAGDRIHTTNSSASLILAGGSVQVSPNSSIVYSPGTVTLDDGTMRVVTSSGVGGHVLNLAVHTASSGTVRYELRRSESQVSVAALEGKLVINDGHDQIRLDAGHAVMMAVQGNADGDAPTCKEGDKKCEAAMKKCKKKDKKDDDACKRAAAGGAAIGGAGAGAAAQLSTAAIVGIAVATAAGVAASAGIAGLNTPPASPVQ